MGTVISIFIDNLCDVCYGTGKYPVYTHCENCNGTGWQYSVSGSIHHAWGIIKPKSQS